jgi:5-methylcytosine-specific restriction enzyme A
MPKTQPDPKNTYCALCERQVGKISMHHLVPKSWGGEETIPLCSPCHGTLHKFFTNRTLAKEKYSLTILRQDPEIARYLAWVRKQPDRAIKVRPRRNRV